METKEKLAELRGIRSALDRVAECYCNTPEEEKVVKTLSLRLFCDEILPIVKVEVAKLKKDAEELLVQFEKEVQGTK